MKLVKPKSRDIFRSSMQVITCPVNTVGTMGNGLAAAFRDRIPGLDNVYKQRVSAGYITPLGLNVSNLVGIGHDRYVLLFPTKAHWLDDSQLSYIESGLSTLAHVLRQNNLSSIAIPRLGCGKGKLDWDRQVRPLILQHLADTGLEVELYE